MTGFETEEIMNSEQNLNEDAGGGSALNDGLDVTAETRLFMEWAGSQPVELEDKHLDELGFWCWQAWQARAKLSSNAN